jgi:predicted SnoaL-like aldol condensation-catalyzing enzyme
MTNSGAVIRNFYEEVVRRDFAGARKFLHDDLVFVGLFETYANADAYLKTLAGLMQITTRLDVRAVIAEGDDVAVFFELETKAPAEATTLVAEWHRLKGGKIHHVESAFDGRPFAAMFAGASKPPA